MISIEDLIEYYEKINPNKSASTYSTMKYNLIRMSKILKKDINDIVLSDLADIQKFEKSMKDYKLNTKIQTILGVKLFIKYKNGNMSQVEPFNQLLKKYCLENQKDIEKNEMSENEKKNWIDYIDLKEKYLQFYEYKFESGIEEKINDYQKYNFIRNFLLLGLYILLPPTRIGNYQLMKIREKKKRKASSLSKEHNYIMDNGDGSYQLVFNQYKTSQYLGQQENTILKDSRLSNILKTYMDIREKFINNKKETNLFVNKDKRAMTQPNITDCLKYQSRKIIGKELSVNLLRHIFLTWFINQNKSIEEKKKVAHFIGQSYDAPMMEKYYRKPTKEDKPIIEKKDECSLNFD
tara:strand:- start:2200 stop:3249 length:1050 start_codon:yes stop_codon:yes gene_type:complete